MNDEARCDSVLYMAICDGVRMGLMRVMDMVFFGVNFGVDDK